MAFKQLQYILLVEDDEGSLRATTAIGSAPRRGADIISHKEGGV